MQTMGVHKRWRLHEAQERGVSCEGLAGDLGVHPVVAAILARRGFADRSSVTTLFHPRLNDLHDPSLLPGIDRAAGRMVQAVREGQPIVIYGDYDVDGITASAILWHTLRSVGATPQIYVPHRIEEGYGLNSDALVELSHGQPLIITVDCGITAVEPARVAKDAGIDLIITDHHEFDTQGQERLLPDAHTLVHPRLAGSQYPFEGLCGAAVAFKLAWQFARDFCGSQRLPDPMRRLLLDLISYVALGTIADVVPLMDENRVLAVYGLGQIKRTQFAGLNALIDATRLRDEQIDAYHVGFALAPRINAAGRMGHADDAIRLLTDATPDEAVRIAGFLTQENERRRTVERSIFKEAKQMVLDHGYDGLDHRAIVVGKEGWHRGVVGIVASRLVEAFGRPAVVLSYDEEPDSTWAHGSARSVEGVSIYEALEHCCELLGSFGGHAMAAGLRLDVEQVEEFRQRLVGFVNDRLGPDDLVGVLGIDAVCSLDDVRMDLFEQIQKLAPFGRGNPAPVLCVEAATTDQPAQRMGKEGSHMRVMLRQGRRLVSAVGFGLGDLVDRLPAGVTVDVAFEPKISTWQGRRRAEMHIKDLRIGAG